MTITKRLSAIALTLIMLVSFIPMTVFAASGKWVNKGTSSSPAWYYVVNGKNATGWQKIDGRWYYFTGDGLMQANRAVYESNGKVYMLDKNGTLMSKRGWVQVQYNESGRTAWFYVMKGGEAATGWKKISGKWYYFNDKNAEHLYGEYGEMISVPSVGISGKVYAFNSNGSMVTKTGWVSLKFKGTPYWFYMKKGGVATTGWKKLDKKWYYFAPKTGAMVCNASHKIDGKTYNFDKNGVCTNP